ncbi:hypothetical protein FQN57_002431 [Myotisia sp. PD_48]|nr:hypothetical protein FQN57_002431 [Myotisia sp. PD_48]
MSEKPTSVAAYAAGASLAAIALFYVFGPNYTIDGEESNNSGRKKGIVGLENPANDCFINSVLQALAGLGELRLYLIRELHRRNLEGVEIYNALPAPEAIKPGQTPEKVRQLQLAPVTQALKYMLDALNERPIYKKTISSREFLRALEAAFRTRINRSQQDAHEFLQVVVERMCDEFHAGIQARKAALDVSQTLGRDPEKLSLETHGLSVRIQSAVIEDSDAASLADSKSNGTRFDPEEPFPLEGTLESQIQCQHCHYKYKPSATSFVNLTLQVPQKSSTTLGSCFDGLLKTEFIDDFRCEKCELTFALEQKIKAIARTTSPSVKKSLEREISLLEAATVDPEISLEDVSMPDPRTVPRRKIAKHMRITVYPKIIAIHLSRSIFDTYSTKNAAKVSFPERLTLGGILDKKMYRLLAIVCHKGNHHSGHYESFRRNHVYAPFSTPDVFRSYAQSRSQSRNPSTMPSPKIKGNQKPPDMEPSPLAISPVSGSSSTTASTVSFTLPTPATPSSSSRPSSLRTSQPQTSSRSESLNSPRPRTRDRSPSTSISSKRPSKAPSIPDLAGKPKKSSIMDGSRLRRKKKQEERWWRISDERIKECKTSDVLGMQKEVYLLFYELERPNDDNDDDDDA